MIQMELQQETALMTDCIFHISKVGSMDRLYGPLRCLGRCYAPFWANRGCMTGEFKATSPWAF